MTAPLEDPPHLRTLRRLVNALTVVLILGFITVVVVIVIRFASPATPPPALPENMAIPTGETTQAVTLGRNWAAVVTIDKDGHERIRLFALDGTPLQNLEIGTPE